MEKEPANGPRASEPTGSSGESWLDEYKNEHKEHTNAKQYFLMDYQNLQESPWMRDGIILADWSIRRFFIDHIKAEPLTTQLYPDFEARVSRIVELPVSQILRRAEDGHRYVWLGAATPGFWWPHTLSDSRYQPMRARFAYCAHAVGSLFNWGYWGIQLFRTVNVGEEIRRYEVARYFKGRVYKNDEDLAKCEGGLQ